MHSPAPEALETFAPRPEQTFFSEPAIDRALGIIMALAAEVYVLRNRQFALERQLADSGALDVQRLNAEPSSAETAATAADGDAFVAHLMSSVFGLQTSKGVVG